jgi:hypothetical protein
MISTRPPIPLGRTLATPGALAAFQRSGDVPADFLRRHECQDWGNIGDDDWARNDAGLKNGLRIVSSYTLRDGEKIWIITEADRTATTILLPDEY